TASTGKRTSDIRLVRAHLSHHCFRLAMDMVAKKFVARRFTVMLRLGNFERLSHTIHLSSPTQHLQHIQRAAGNALAALLQPNMIINGCGIVASDISPAGQSQQSLFEPSTGEERSLPLWQTMQEARNRFGNGIIRPAITLARPTTRQPQSQRFGYPLITCK
ncbi:MAG TPA: hypothetical protein VKA31_07665, partial [Mariprofundaceae bacterium]|nr:hypothetical protein [Mariprofundaceae bacterium]